MGVAFGLGRVDFMPMLCMRICGLRHVSTNPQEFKELYLPLEAYNFHWNCQRQAHRDCHVQPRDRRVLKSVSIARFLPIAYLTHHEGI